MSPVHRPRTDRVRSLPAWLAAEHRGRVWEPSQGSHRERVRSLPAWLAAEHRGRVWEPSQGSPSKVLDSATRRLRRGGSCQLGPAPRRVLRSIHLAECTKRASGSAPAARAARDLRARRVPSLTATRPRLRRLDIGARVARESLWKKPLPPRVPITITCGACQLGWQRSIAGGFGNPPRVPIMNEPAHERGA
jgi:hypothetical protein